MFDVLFDTLPGTIAVIPCLLVTQTVELQSLGIPMQLDLCAISVWNFDDMGTVLVLLLECQTLVADRALLVGAHGVCYG
jgi:hypothetical protein